MQKLYYWDNVDQLMIVGNGHAFANAESVDDAIMYIVDAYESAGIIGRRKDPDALEAELRMKTPMILINAGVVVEGSE